MSYRTLEFLAAGFIGGFAFWSLDTIRARGWRAALGLMLPRRLATRLGWRATRPTEAPSTGERPADTAAERTRVDDERHPTERRSAGPVDPAEDRWAAAGRPPAMEVHRGLSGTGARGELAPWSESDRRGKVALETMLAGPPPQVRGLAAEITIQDGASVRAYTIVGPVTLIGGSDRAHVHIPGARATAIVEQLEDVALVRAAEADAPVWLGGRSVGIDPVPITSSNAVLDVQPASIVVASLAAPTPPAALDLSWLDEAPGLVVRQLPGRVAAVWGDVAHGILTEMAAAGLDTLVPHPSGPGWALRVALDVAPPGRDVGILLAVTDEEDGAPVCRLATAGAVTVRRRSSDEQPWRDMAVTSLGRAAAGPLSTVTVPLGDRARLGVEVVADARRVRVDVRRQVGAPRAALR